MEEVLVEPVAFARLAQVLPASRAAKLAADADRARAGFGDRTVWHINATAQGGGVAEMLQTLLAYGNGAGIENRWLVIKGDAEFFTITKRLHNHLHGSPGDGGDLAEPEHAHYRAVLEDNLTELLRYVGRRDIVVLHDPQTAGLAQELRSLGAQVVWRCHVGRDEPNALTDAGWDFLRRHLAAPHALVFSRRAYVPTWVDPAQRVAIIPPSIDPFAVKNMSLAEDLVTSVLARAGLVAGVDPDGPVGFTRRDGTTGDVRRRASGELLLDTDPPPLDAPLVVQVSRWDRLKDMAGVMDGFARAVGAADLASVHLVLAGPDVSGVDDDPEGAAVLAECRRRWHDLPAGVRERVHLASLPMEDVDENAVIVNALQRHARVVAQKSLVEGFGLTVTEAMWKGRAVVASRVGGIQDQITDGQDGLLVDDPHDLDAFAGALRRALADPELAARLGVAARERVRHEFLGDRHLSQYVDLFAALVGDAR